MTDRRDLIRLAAVLTALLVLAGGIMLLTQGGADDGDSGAAADGTQLIVDGVVTEVTPEKLVLRPNDGTPLMTFLIRATERPSFDIFHLQEHAADGLSTRVTYVKQGERTYALRADDAPVPGG